MRLSRRVLHFCAQEVVWVCRVSQKSESVDNDQDFTSEDEWSGRAYPYVPYGILEKNPKEQDKMAALSGLAEQMQSLRPPEDRYLVGLWEKTLLSDLLWTQGWSYTAPNSRISRYPSWSWASSPYQVEWSRDFNISLKCTQVEATKVTTRGPSHMANCIEATITLKAPLLDATPLLTAAQAHIAASRVSGDYESSSPFGNLYPDPYDAFITNLDHLISLPQKLLAASFF
ncbi:uncharacterized protein CCOS01_07262 [Colletotrichum costaricense]|uniref:Uncharacterized protein n=1 Tax=Colletotrichum costaricense TaxID=1209916 RepID=A0AAI9YW81_9PEZI|nr:uncharacterized protein CCOS01_07262 [Colletotrichum costaricense]KAK1527000.1 hypothetical protein CCOS01_07262 [Colletotrichum costaricense]